MVHIRKAVIGYVNQSFLMGADALLRDFGDFTCPTFFMYVVSFSSFWLVGLGSSYGKTVANDQRGYSKKT